MCTCVTYTHSLSHIRVFLCVSLVDDSLHCKAAAPLLCAVCTWQSLEQRWRPCIERTRVASAAPYRCRRNASYARGDLLSNILALLRHLSRTLRKNTTTALRTQQHRASSGLVTGREQLRGVGREGRGEDGQGASCRCCAPHIVLPRAGLPTVVNRPRVPPRISFCYTLTSGRHAPVGPPLWNLSAPSTPRDQLRNSAQDGPSAGRYTRRNARLHHQGVEWHEREKVPEALQVNAEF
jgi:hypothetical protein